MKVQANQMNVATYCKAFSANEIIINRDYQRAGGLWSSQSQSFFIESILLGYPIPKIFLFSKLDLKSKKVVKEIVDGQQRTEALVRFFNGKLRLTKNVETDELRGLRYEDLPDDWKSRFLVYSLPIDEFTTNNETEVRNSFRRMNMNNVPVNAEERRNAKYQGPFKFFINKLSTHFQDAMISFHVFTNRDIVRMKDQKLYSHIAYTMDFGWGTIKDAQLNSVFGKYNDEFPLEDIFERVITIAINRFLDSRLAELHSFQRHSVFESAVLAFVSNEFDTCDWPFNFDQAAEEQRRELMKDDYSPVPPQSLDAAVEDPDSHPRLRPYVDAAKQGTNVGKSRILRYLYIKDALQERE